jgi:hypothetical protein
VLKFIPKMRTQWRQMTRQVDLTARLIESMHANGQRPAVPETAIGGEAGANGTRASQTFDLHDWFTRELRNRFLYLEDSGLARRRIAELSNLMVPCSAKGYGKIRLGNKHDGGYVCLDDFSGIEAALSFGIGGDVSWDLEIADRAIPVYQYDDSVENPPVSHRKFRFFRERIGTGGNGGSSIAAISSRHGISEPASAILKIDIECAEWEVFDETPDEALSVFAQIVGEFHSFDEILDDQWFQRTSRVFEKLHKQFRIVHVHGNNYASQIVLGNMLFPRCLEFSFANRSRYDLSPSGEVFPGELDAPNDPSKPDCGLSRFDYEMN